MVTTSFFGIVDKEYLAEKLDFPFSCIESFDNEMLCKAEWVTHEVFQYWEAKKPTENCALSTEHKSFRYPKDSETQRGSPTNFRGGIREKNSTEKSVINLLDMKFFDSRTFLIYQSVPQRNLSAP